MTQTNTILFFSVAEARLGLRVEEVVEVLPLMSLRRVPETPELVEGFLAFDGGMVPVIRLERLLRLEMQGIAWNPQKNLSSRIVVARLPTGLLAWIVAEGVNLARVSRDETVRLPAGHTLNNCAQWVIARQPPEPSIVLLEPSRLLLEKERLCLEELRARVEERLAALNVI